MASAMTAGAAATGMRAWLNAHQPRWMTPRRLRIATALILLLGVLAAGSHLAPNAPGGREPGPPHEYWSHVSK